MNVDLTPDQRALVKRAIESGRFSHEEEAVQEALALWEERERRRLEILAAIDEAEASLAQGEGRPITEESMKALAEDIKERGRRRLAAERTASALMDFRVAPQAESDLDEIWYFLATQSSSIDVADRVVDSITARFVLLARQPYIGRRRDEDLRPGVRTFPVGDYVIAYRVDGDDVLILRVLRGSRDIEALFRE